MQSMNKTVADDCPKIYAACLAAYNNGILHGAWIDATQDPDDIKADIQAMLTASPCPGAEEYAIHDYDNFYEMSLGEWPDLEEVSALASLLVEHGEVVACVYNDWPGGGAENVRHRMDEQYCGAWEGTRDYAMQYLDNIGAFQGVPEIVCNYFDFDAFARDLELGGDIDTYHTRDGMTHIFLTR